MENSLYNEKQLQVIKEYLDENVSIYNDWNDEYSLYFDFKTTDCFGEIILVLKSCRDIFVLLDFVENKVEEERTNWIYTKRFNNISDFFSDFSRILRNSSESKSEDCKYFVSETMRCTCNAFSKQIIEFFNQEEVAIIIPQLEEILKSEDLDAFSLNNLLKKQEEITSAIKACEQILESNKLVLENCDVEFIVNDLYRSEGRYEYRLEQLEKELQPLEDKIARVKEKMQA